MSYEALTWVDRDKTNGVTGTKLNADNMNRIEQGIKALASQVATINITDEQITLLTTVKSSLEEVQSGLSSLKRDFEAHVHSNEAGNTTGAYVIEK